MGQVVPRVVASTFAVFNPAVVEPCVQYGWGLTDAPTIFAARRGGAVAQLRRILGERPVGLDARSNCSSEPSLRSMSQDGRCSQGCAASGTIPPIR